MSEILRNNYLQNNQVASNVSNIVSSNNNGTNQTNTNQEHTITITNQTQQNKDNTNTNAIQTHSSNNKRYYYIPFLKVAYPIANVSSGFHHTPRVGYEVIIFFLNNDIDKPYISDNLYNKSNSALSSLPLASHQTSLIARTLNGLQSNTKEAGTTNSHYNPLESRLNEITLSNIKDNEEIYVRAEKDYNEYIKHNFSQRIQNNKDFLVLGSYTESITKYHKQEILGLKDVRVGAEYLTNVALSKDTIIGLISYLKCRCR